MRVQHIQLTRFAVFELYDYDKLIYIGSSTNGGALRRIASQAKKYRVTSVKLYECSTRKEMLERLAQLHNKSTTTPLLLGVRTVKGRRVFTDAEEREIYVAYTKNGKSQQRLANDLGVSQTTICRALTRQHQLRSRTDLFCWSKLFASLCLTSTSIPALYHHSSCTAVKIISASGVSTPAYGIGTPSV